MGMAAREIPGTARGKGRVVRAKPARLRQMEHDAALAAKDREIAHLHSRLECAARHLRYIQPNGYRLGAPQQRALHNAIRAVDPETD